MVCIAASMSVGEWDVVEVTYALGRCPRIPGCFGGLVGRVHLEVGYGHMGIAHRGGFQPHGCQDAYCCCCCQGGADHGDRAWGAPE